MSTEDCEIYVQRGKIGHGNLQFEDDNAIQRREIFPTQFDANICCSRKHIYKFNSSKYLLMSVDQGIEKMQERCEKLCQNGNIFKNESFDLLYKKSWWIATLVLVLVLK